MERFLHGAWRDVGINVLRSVTVALALGVLSFLTLTRPLAAIVRRITQGPAGASRAEPMPEALRRDEIGLIAQAFERYEREAGERARSLEASARALAASEVRYRRIVETAGEGVWQLDGQGGTVLANVALARMLGTTPERMLGRPLLEFVDPGDQAVAQGYLLGGPRPEVERFELRFRRSDGQAVWAEVSTCPVVDADGRSLGTLAMVTNATERRRRDEQLKATNARLQSMVADLQRHKSDMAQIAELNGLLQSARTEDEAFDIIRAVAAHLFRDCPGGFSVAGPDDEMHVVGAWGDADSLPAHYRRSACWAIRRGGPHRETDDHGVRCGHRAPQQAGSMLCTPLYVEGELIGVLHLRVEAGPSALEGSVQQRTEVFGEVVKLGLSNLRLRETLSTQALRDALTGLPNRRMADETLPRELLRCLRAGEPLTLALVDVDHFKRFNDTYGHDAGDRVLCAVAQVLVKHLRASDLACRYGGDEFLCVLPGMTAEDARSRFEAALGQMAENAGSAGLPDETITFTVGLAAAPDCGSDAAALASAADVALYAAKARGRNCVEVAAAGTTPTLFEPSGLMPTGAAVTAFRSTRV
jgi:diguanylate cyclase (GGDEF)-like protein/PAS domain S-box-containing protein